MLRYFVDLFNWNKLTLSFALKICNKTMMIMMVMVGDSDGEYDDGFVDEWRL